MTDDRQIPEATHPSDRSQAPDAAPGNLVSRRQVLTAGAASAVSFLVLPQAARGWSENGPVLSARGPSNCCTVAPYDCSSPRLTEPSDPYFPFPIELTSTLEVDAECLSSGTAFRTLTANLDVVAKENTPSPGVYTRRLQIRGTNELGTPGPTLCVYPGDQIALNIKNDLPPNGEETYCSNPLPDELKNRPHCFNTTNIHFHGLHVSPLTYTPDGPVTGDDPAAKEPGAKSSDDVLFPLHPGEDHNWCVQLPDFHAPGTHWYHAHVHGSTALEVSNGTIGALIVQEPPGQEILAGAPDVVMVIQEILPKIPCSAILGLDAEQCNTTPPPVSAQQSQDRGIYELPGNSELGTFLINGQYIPNLTIQKGEVQRWRLINGTGTPRGFMVIEVVQTARYNPYTGKYDQIQGIPLTQQTLYCVAIDGITLYGKSMTGSEVRVTSHELSPGNRVDFLVDLPPGEYQLQKQSFPNVGASKPGVLAKITVTPQSYYDASLKERFDTLLQGNIPGEPPCYLTALPDSAPLNPKWVVFQASFSQPADPITTPGRGDFKISDVKYGHPEAEITVPLGADQDWILANVSGATHPFHIHVNPFQIVAKGTVPENGYNSELPICEDNPQIDWDADYTPDEIWWDTIAVEPGKALKIRHRFFDYWGTFVLHCHVLIHEDQGMMWTVNITNPNGKGINPCETLATCVTDYGNIPAPGEPVPCPEPLSSQTQTTPTQGQKGRGPGGGRGRGRGGGRGRGRRGEMQ